MLKNIEVSVIIVANVNSEPWLDQCMEAISEQTVLEIKNMRIEIVVCNYGKSESVDHILRNWKEYFKKHKINLVITEAEHYMSIGAVKNGTIDNSCGRYLCFQRPEDTMLPNRISTQLKYAQRFQNAIVGCLGLIPDALSEQLSDNVQWANDLRHFLLKTRIYTSHGATILSPTWFCSRSVYDKVGGFNVVAMTPFHDLIFFYNHVTGGGDLVRIDEYLLKMPYHECTLTLSPTKVENQFLIQLSTIEKAVFTLWETFTIWNSCKVGRKVVRNLTENGRKKVKAFCDSDEKLIGTKIDLYCPKKKGSIIRLPIIHYLEAKPLLLICAELTKQGEVEDHLKTMRYKEGVHYIIFTL